MQEIDRKEVVKIVIDELDNRGIIKRNLNSFDNTIKLLYEYPKLKESIKDREEQIEDLKKYGIPSKSKSITSINMGTKREEEDEIIEDNINSLKQHIYRTKVVIRYIDRVLEKIKNDKYYDVIRLYYFEKKTLEQIAEYFDKKRNKDATSPETIRTNKTRLIYEIKTYLFPNDTLTEILGYWQNWKMAGFWLCLHMVFQQL